MDLLVLIFLDDESTAAFTFAVMERISKQLAVGTRFYMTIQLDELQVCLLEYCSQCTQSNPEFAQQILRVLGKYMCATDINIKALSVEHNIVIFPVVTATSSSGMKHQVKLLY